MLRAGRNPYVKVQERYLPSSYPRASDPADR
jgi:hypothetical protein